ncbi:MAG TPA: ATP-binding protein [Pyrinomonadaceae bacterium]|jgi:signal transduction histidine kinase/FixJ family two-component response regulator
MLKTGRESYLNHSALTESEQAQACCLIAHEHLKKGEFDEGCAALERWWTIGEWPRMEGLDQRAAAELLFTAGSLSGWTAGAKQVAGGQKNAESLLSGSITLFNLMGERRCSAESKIELAYCYYRQGLFDYARAILREALNDLSEQDSELKGTAFIRLAIIERHAGRLREALSLLDEASAIIETDSPWSKGRYHLELATTLKNLGTAEKCDDFFAQAQAQYREALNQFSLIGNKRYCAIVENNHGYLLISLNQNTEAEQHLIQAHHLFESLEDNVRRAQVEETLTQLYIVSNRFDLAVETIERAIETLETSGADALFAEALTTKGLVLSKLGHQEKARLQLEQAQRVAERCGDYEGAGRAALILIEELFDYLSDEDRREVGSRADKLLSDSQQSSIKKRLEICLENIADAHAKHEQQREQAAHAEKMRALGELSFGVAHNVNNALTGILGRAQLLLKSDPEKMRNGLKMIIKSAEDGAQIVRRIQDFACQRRSRDFQPISITELLKDTWEMTRPRWEHLQDAQAIRFVIETACNAYIMGDEVELREVLVNLVYNAVDAMPQGGAIYMGVHEEFGKVVLSISDTGTGMSPEVKSRIFDPFFTTKGKGGTGMGLAVSFGIIRRHEGSVEVESEEGHGTTFRITLPPAFGLQVLSPQPEADHIGASQVTEKVRVLVVDDDATVRELLGDTLEEEGCEVVTAKDGEEALEMYNSSDQQFDAIFTDIGMKEMSGWDLVSAVRQKCGEIPLAIVSGWGDTISADQQREMKTDWVVAKPFDIDRISQIAKEIASRKKDRMTQQAQTQPQTTVTSNHWATRYQKIRQAN